ncbi:hypothetical protein P7K49_004323, partial [Saguinus oedipus]
MCHSRTGKLRPRSSSEPLTNEPQPHRETDSMCHSHMGKLRPVNVQEVLPKAGGDLGLDSSGVFFSPQQTSDQKCQGPSGPSGSKLKPQDV